MYIVHIYSKEIREDERGREGGGEKKQCRRVSCSLIFEIAPSCFVYVVILRIAATEHPTSVLGRQVKILSATSSRHVMNFLNHFSIDYFAK